MQSEHPHPLLAQVPLTVSPFLSLPTGTTLPYTYKSLPGTLPPSITDTAHPSASNDTSANPPNHRPSYVHSTTSNHSAHPDDIIASCQALQTHLQKLQDEARATVAKWEEDLKARELAEKRRVAPGWLDAEQRILVPERVAGGGESEDLLGQEDEQQKALGGVQGGEGGQEGEELDRAFGGGGMSQLAFRSK